MREPLPQVAQAAQAAELVDKADMRWLAAPEAVAALAAVPSIPAEVGAVGVAHMAALADREALATERVQLEQRVPPVVLAFAQRSWSGEEVEPEDWEPGSWEETEAPGALVARPLAELGLLVALAALSVAVEGVAGVAATGVILFHQALADREVLAILVGVPLAPLAAPEFLPAEVASRPFPARTQHF